jgi:hypothetical protein
VLIIIISIKLKVIVIACSECSEGPCYQAIGRTTLTR